jgi:hypothetical protein
MEGCVTIITETSAGNVPGLKMNTYRVEFAYRTISYVDECNAIDDYKRRSELGRNSREEGKNSRETGRAA